MKFSIIVPVYNTSKYLNKCIGSIIGQTYENWELIIIDDGSTDDSANIIDKYSKADSRIIPVYHDNQGPGKTRNLGISTATGDYVIFVDSDDYIENDYLELLNEKAKFYDVVFIDVNQVTEEGRLLKKEYISKYKHYTKEEFLCAQMTGRIPWGGVRKTANLEFIKKHNILYSDDCVGEEALYSFKLVYFANNIGFIDKKPLYYYVNRLNSQSKKPIEDPLKEVYLKIADFVRNKGVYSRFASTLNAFNITSAIISIDRLNNFYSKKTYRQKLKQKVQDYSRLYDCNYGINYKSMSVKALIFVPCFKLQIYWPITLASNIKKIFKPI